MNSQNVEISDAVLDQRNGKCEVFRRLDSDTGRMIRVDCPVYGTLVPTDETHGEGMKIDDVAKLLSKKRGSMGLRAAASEIGISPTTLSRIENGHVPDVATLNKICVWLEEDPSQFTGIGGLQVAFKKKQTAPPRTAQSLARLIELASKQFAKDIDAEGH